MGKRVRQPDGTYCYTPGCRIHERFDTKEGVDAVVYDMRKLLFKDQEKSVLNLLKGQEDFLTEGPTRQIHIRQLARQLSESLSDNGVPGVPDLNLRIGRMFGWSDNDITMDSDIWDKLSTLSLEISSAVSETASYLPGDHVAFVEGGAGVVSKTPPLRGPVTVMTVRNGRREMVTVPSDSIVRLMSTQTHARTRIVALTDKETITSKVVSDLLDEETDNSERDDTMAYHNVPSRSMPAVRQELVEAGNRFNSGFADQEVTKTRILRFLHDEAAKRRTWLDLEDREPVQTAFNNILRYLTVNR